MTKSLHRLTGTARLVMLFTCLLIASMSYGISTVQPINLAEHSHGQTTGDSYYYLQDRSGSMTIDQVIYSGLWQIPRPGETNRGLSPDPTWMRFWLHNPNLEKRQVILEYIDASVQQIELYDRPAGGLQRNFKEQRFNYNQAVSERAVAFYRPAFIIDVEPGQTREVYARIFQGNEFPMHSFSAFRIWQETSFYRATDIQLALLMILLCTNIFMAVATIAAYFILRDKLFLYYAAFALSAASLFAANSGLWSYFIISENYPLWSVVLQINICQIAAILFVRQFLQTAHHMPLIDWALRAVILIDIIGVVLNLTGYPGLSRSIIDYTAWAYLLLIPIGLYAHHKGVRHALLFTASWVAFIIGMALASLRYRGYIADTFLSEWMIYIGGFIEASLLMSIMVLRIRDIQLEQLRLERSHRLALEQAADELNQKVAEQTRQLKQAKEQAEKEARTDMLTGLTNRRCFFELANHCPQEQQFLLMIDIDHFKKVNDSFGHAAGDKVLQKVAIAITQTTRHNDLAARLGGEEFAIVTQAPDMQSATQLAERLRVAIAQLELQWEGQEIALSCSIGVASREQNTSLYALMKQADRALYEAKAQGRNRVVSSPS